MDNSSHISKHVTKGFIWKTFTKKPICTSSGDYYVPAFNALAVPSRGTHCCLIKIVGRYFFLMVSLTVSYNSDMLAGQQSGNCSSINSEEIKQHLIAIKQRSWLANQVCGAVPNALNMGIQGQIWPRGRIMELAAGVHACCLPSENRVTPVSGVNHSRDLDLDWQSMSVH